MIYDVLLVRLFDSNTMAKVLGKTLQAAILFSWEKIPFRYDLILPPFFPLILTLSYSRSLLRLTWARHMLR